MSQDKPEQDFAIAGAGLMGMTLALRLAERGHNVTLYDAAASQGGLASPWQLGEVTWDRFYHVTLLSDSYLRDLLKRLDLDSDMKWVETKTGFYADGKLHSMSNSVEFLKFPPLNLLEKFRLGWTIFYTSRIKNAEPLEKVLVADWLCKISGKGVFEKIWLPLLRAKLGDSYKVTSAAFIWTTINRMYAARRTGLKKEMFGYVPGGYSRVVAKMNQELSRKGVKFVPGHALTNVCSVDSQQVELSFANGEKRKHDNVVLTLPAPLISKICPELGEEEKTRFEAIRYIGVVCASLLLKKPISPYYVTNIIDTWVPLTGVIEMSTIVDRSELGGNSLVYLPRYMDSDDPGFERSDEDFLEEMLSTLEKMYSDFSRDDLVEFQIARARHVMALPTLDYTENLPEMKTTLPGVFVVNSAQITRGTLNVNETIQVAENAMATVLSDEQRRVEPKSPVVASR